MVDEQIRQTRRSLKLVDLASGLITLVIGILVFLLSVSVLEHWVIPGGWNGLTRGLLFAAMIGGIAWYSWRTFWPLISRPINPAYAAQLIERSTPSLKNSLLNFLLLRNRRQQLSQKVYQAIEQQAAQKLSEVSLDSVIDRTALLRLGYVLVAVVALCALYRVLSPKNLTASMERVLLPWSNIAAPSRVEILSVTPGDTEIARGQQLEVSAEVHGLRTDEPVRVMYSTLDNQTVDREVLLSASEGGLQYRGRLPDRFSGGESGGIQQDLEYWVEAGDAKSPKYKVNVFARPTLVVEKIRYQFPAYTGLPPREVEGTGDISALEGTKVSVYALANQEIASANVDFGADGRHDLPMTADGEKASAQFELALEEDRRTPEHDSYVLQYKTTKGRTSTLPPKYNIDVTPDYAPEIRILAPVDEEGKLVEQLDVPVDTPFTIEVEARDPDFGLANVVILGEVAGEQVLQHDLLTQEQPGKYVGRMTATPQELNLKPGDILEYWATAIDNRQPEPNVAKTDRLRIRVLGPPDFGKQGQGEQPGEQGNQGGESGESGEGESGEQGEGQAGGGAGEGGEQQEGEGEGAAGEQGGEGQSEGEQQGQEGQGGGEGENSDSQESQGTGGGESQGGEPASAGGEKGEGDQQGDQQSDPNGQGGENPSEGQPGGQGKVSAEGDNDGEAFERMNEHFAEQQAQSEDNQSQGEQESQGQEGQTGEEESQTEQSEGASETQSGQGDGEGSPENQEASGAESGQNQDQGIDGTQEGEQSEGAGAEGQPNEQRGEPASAGGEENQEDKQQEAPGGEMSTEQGEQGAGNNPGENEGSMDNDGGRKPRDKSDEGKPESEMNDQEAPGQANGQKESDSEGASGGDQSGGGQEGAGQQADAEGTGAAGENTAADDGGGQAAEPGAGENSTKPGQQGESDKPTGESSEDKPGEGSKQSDQEGGNKPGGEQGQSAPGAEGEQQPGEAPTSDDPAAAGENGEQPPNNADPSGKPGQAPPNGGTGSNDASPPPPGELEPGDAANLEYAKKQTDLVLDRLDEQLKKSDVDKELLEKLGWTEQELRQFVDRWKKLKAEVEAAPDEETKQELDNALRSLGLNPNRRTGFKSQAIKEKLRELQDSYRGRTPLEYADQVRAYMKGTATVAEEKEE